MVKAASTDCSARSGASAAHSDTSVNATRLLSVKAGPSRRTKTAPSVQSLTPGPARPTHNDRMTLFDRLFGKSGPDELPEDRLPADRQALVDASSAAHRAAELLRAPTALMQLGANEALAVVGFMQPRRYEAGTTIIRQGEADDNGFMVLVLDGEITVEKFQASRRAPVTLSVLGQGSLIGEMSLVDGEARSASCTASTAVHCAVLTRPALAALIAEQPATGAKLMTAVASRLAERLRESGQKLQVYAQLVQTLQQEIDALDGAGR